MKLEKLSIARRLNLGFGVLILGLVLVAASGIRGLAVTNDSLVQLVEVNVVKMELLREMSDAIHVVNEGMRTIALLHDDGEIEREQAKIYEARTNYDKAFESMKKLPLGATGKAFVEKVGVDTVTVRAINNKFLVLAKTSQDEAVKVLLRDVVPMNAEWQNELHTFIQFQIGKNHKEEAAARAAYQSSLTLMSSLTVAAVLISLVLSYLIARSIVRQLGAEPDYTVALADAIARGDLTSTITVRPGDQSSLLHAIKRMRDGLEQIVRQVREGTETIAVASAEISSGNQDLSSRTEHQASSLEETASSMEELTTTVRQNAEHAAQASELALDASGHAEKGGQVVHEVVQMMGSINASSKKIVDIISVIDGIAFQTNILALNAAVEAARAGEQGRGFAVVASEVRNLAQRSASAAREIKHLIDDSVARVAAGTKLVDQAGNTMQQVVASVQKVTHIVGEIAAASREQNSGIAQINEAITQMDTVTQQNAALVEEAAAAAQAMRDQALGLTQVVGIFRVAAAARAAVPLAKVLKPTAVEKTVLASRRRCKTHPLLAQAMIEGGWAEF